MPSASDNLSCRGPLRFQPLGPHVQIHHGMKKCIETLEHQLQHQNWGLHFNSHFRFCLTEFHRCAMVRSVNVVNLARQTDFVPSNPLKHHPFPLVSCTFPQRLWASHKVQSLGTLRDPLGGGPDPGTCRIHGPNFECWTPPWEPLNTREWISSNGADLMNQCNI